jgi:hypothetical protein
MVKMNIIEDLYSCFLLRCWIALNHIEFFEQLDPSLSFLILINSHSNSSCGPSLRAFNLYSGVPFGGSLRFRILVPRFSYSSFETLQHKDCEGWT